MKYILISAAVSIILTGCNSDSPNKTPPINTDTFKSVSIESATIDRKKPTTIATPAVGFYDPKWGNTETINIIAESHDYPPYVQNTSINIGNVNINEAIDDGAPLFTIYADQDVEHGITFQTLKADGSGKGTVTDEITITYRDYNFSCSDLISSAGLDRSLPDINDFASVSIDYICAIHAVFPTIPTGALPPRGIKEDYVSEDGSNNTIQLISQGTVAIEDSNKTTFELAVFKATLKYEGESGPEKSVYVYLHQGLGIVKMSNVHDPFGFDTIMWKGYAYDANFVTLATNSPELLPAIGASAGDSPYRTSVQGEYSDSSWRLRTSN
ncbi:hypothetical protein [Aliivibrio fischeri]|uniref:Lipoprotein n=1 Tax=Aliivibrio fischeri TaxID=668 RepID=A0A510UN13_ALIFS|nr:hypothetical protein [Aliivibrio fischeri]GEK15969.1 hypothetical protein AFI02nite_40050 [Aliivibrio fischeri]